MSDSAVSVTLTIEASSDQVWHAITDGRSSWWPEMVFDAVIGAPLVETWIEQGDVKRASGVITGAVAPRLLTFEWSEPGWNRPLKVRIQLEPLGPTTKITITETGFVEAQTPPTLPAEHEDGWLHHLARLREACARGSKTRTPLGDGC